MDSDPYLGRRNFDQFNLNSHWDNALKTFPRELLTADDEPIQLRSMNLIILKRIYIEGCNWRMGGNIDNIYGNHENPYFKLAFETGWQDYDNYLRSQRQSK